MTRRAKPKYVPRSSREITEIVRILLRVFSPTDNFLIAFEKLKKVFPKLRLKVVADDALPEEEEARAYPSKWLIKIRRGTHDELLSGSRRALWTLMHELAHVVLQHPRVMLPRKWKGKSGTVLEREADVFAVRARMPYDRVKGCKTAEQISAVCHTSLLTAEHRLREIQAEESRHRAIVAHGLSSRDFTDEFGHRADLEDQVAILFDSIRQTIFEFESTGAIIAPFKNNLFSAAILVAAGSGLLLDAYESVGRETGEHEYRKAAILVAAIRSIQPLCVVGASDHRLLEVINKRCAAVAAAKLAQINERAIVTFQEAQDDPFESSFLRNLTEIGDMLITNDATTLSFSNLPNYEAYTHDRDIRWDDVHAIEDIMRQLMIFDYSATRK